MMFRQAMVADIPQIQRVRHSVKENTLSNPALVTDADCENYLMNRGKGWVCEINDRVIAFAIADVIANNVWALFVDPRYEQKGIGRKLHDEMINWYFNQTGKTIWLGTAPNTRAENFYRNAGWVEVGQHGKGEIKFEMSKAAWKRLNEK